jgi:hypothetical protein
MLLKNSFSEIPERLAAAEFMVTRVPPLYFRQTPRNRELMGQTGQNT